MMVLFHDCTPAMVKNWEILQAILRSGGEDFQGFAASRGRVGMKRGVEGMKAVYCLFPVTQTSSGLVAAGASRIRITRASRTTS